MSKVVNDLNAAGREKNAELYLSAFLERFELGTVQKWPGQMRFFGMNIG